MRVFAGLLHRRHTGAGRLPLSRTRRDISVQEQALLLVLSLHIPFRFLLQQPQVQLAKRIGAQASTVESRVIADDADALELLGDAVEDGMRVDPLTPESLE